MEPHLLQAFVTFIAGFVVGIIVMLIANKLRSGSMAPSNIKQEYQDYQEKVEEHFEETSKKFKEMTEQYQDLYKHLSVGATSLCRPDSVAAVLADKSEPTVKLEDKTENTKEQKVAEKSVEEPKEKAGTKASEAVRASAKQEDLKTAVKAEEPEAATPEKKGA